MSIRIGVDAGIGSVGWAVVSEGDLTHPARIEDFGTRIFDSGENAKDRKSNCQQRRAHRGVRRLERRNKYRKKLLYKCFCDIGMVNETFNDELADCRDENVFLLKVKALTEPLMSAALFKCMVHTSNHRGYRDFYEPDEDDEEASQNAAAANAFEKAFRESKLRTVSEYLLSAYSDGTKVKFRNRDGQTGTLIRRTLLQEENVSIPESRSEI